MRKRMIMYGTFSCGIILTSTETQSTKIVDLVGGAFGTGPTYLFLFSISYQ